MQLKVKDFHFDPKKKDNKKDQKDNESAEIITTADFYR